MSFAVLRGLAWVETKHRLRHPAWLFGIAAFVLFFVTYLREAPSDWSVLQRDSVGVARSLLLVGAVSLLINHRSATRERDQGTAELIGVQPYARQAVPLARLAAIVADTAIAGVLAIGALAFLRVRGSTGSVAWMEVTTGIVVVAAMGLLGYLAGSIWKSPSKWPAGPRPRARRVTHRDWQRHRLLSVVGADRR
jgi:hypothetical protein